MYTAVSACLKQLEESFNTTFNHAFVYVIRPRKTALRTLLLGPQLQFDQIFQHGVGPVFVIVHVASKCSCFNDMQVMQIMQTLLKVFQVCFSVHDSSLNKKIFLFWTSD